LSFILTGILILCGILFTLYAFLFPKQPIDSEIRELSTSKLVHVKDLRSKSLLQLGDESAANFPYVIDPIQGLFNDTVQILLDASTDITRIKRGILIYGESNAGKTRLALETLQRTLPFWPVLRWKPVDTMDDNLIIEVCKNERLVIFIDDLQDFVPSQIIDDSRSMKLISLLEDLFQFVQSVVIVATCRTEDKYRVEGFLSKLFLQLTEINIPTFSLNKQDPQTKKIFAEFRKQGDIKDEDWDGTLGSLVLGLSTKKSQYLKLADLQPFDVQVLKAMKLLRRANTIEHTVQRIQAVCAGVFGKEELQKIEIWRETVEHLTSMQFVMVDNSEPEELLVIRKDIYFEEVITNYPHFSQPNQIEQDFKPLREVLAKLEDVEALSNMSVALFMLKKFEEAMSICDQALSINSQSIQAWSTKAFLLTLLGQHEEALTALNQALSLDSQNAVAWSNKGTKLVILNRLDEALTVFDNALSLDPQSVIAWFNKGMVLEELSRHEEALVALNQALFFNPNNADVWFRKGNALVSLNRDEEALAAFDQALSLYPNNTYPNPNAIYAWTNKGGRLIKLDRNEEALACLDHALSLNPNNITAWNNKGAALEALGRYEEAITAFDRAIELDPKCIGAWNNKGAALGALGRYEEVL